MIETTTRNHEIFMAVIGFVALGLGIFCGVMTITNWTSLSIDLAWLSAFIAAGWIGMGVFILKNTLPIKSKRHVTNEHEK